MIDILYSPTKTTPHFLVDSSEGLISLKGKSSPENALMFYYPIINQLEELFAGSTVETVRVEMALEYFNTSSSKCLFDLFKVLRKIENAGKEVVVNWYYEFDDEDMLETGEDFADLTDLHFEMIELDDEHVAALKIA